MNNPSVRDACATLKNCGYEQTAAEVQEAFTALAAEVEGLREKLGECYVMAGADTDGDPPERHADDALRAVTDLRRDYDNACEELHGANGWKPRAEQAEAKLAACEADVRALGGFAAFVLQYNEDFIGDIDGGTLQDAAEKYGLLAPIEVTGPCGEGCNCASYGDFPQDCYRRTPTMKRAIAAMQEKPHE